MRGGKRGRRRRRRLSDARVVNAREGGIEGPTFGGVRFEVPATATRLAADGGTGERARRTAHAAVGAGAAAAGRIGVGLDAAEARRPRPALGGVRVAGAGGRTAVRTRRRTGEVAHPAGTDGRAARGRGARGAAGRSAGVDAGVADAPAAASVAAGRATAHAAGAGAVARGARPPRAAGLVHAAARVALPVRTADRAGV